MQRAPLVNSLHLGSNSVSAPLLQRRRAAAILMAIAIAVPSRLAASGVTPPVTDTCFFRMSNWALKLRRNCGSRYPYNLL